MPVESDDWAQNGTMIHDVGVLPPRVWKIANFRDTGVNFYFDAVCIMNEVCLQGYTFKEGAEKPAGWRLVGEMEAISLNGMSREEYLRWQKAWYQKQGAWHDRDKQG